MKAVNKTVLERWRAMDAHVVLNAIADYSKQDRTFDPRKSHDTTRWHAHIAGHDVELLCTGPKFFDTRAHRGGGGAVDMVMHLYGVDFKAAVAQLQSSGL
jgi:hypothetical protein